MKGTIIILTGLFLSIAVAFAQGTTTLELQPGQNNITVESFFYPMYVSTLVANNPEIQSVTLEDYGRSFGYVNVFGGIGLDFLIEQDKTYEIYVSEAINVTLR